MSLETFTGTNVPELLARARAEMGAEAVLVSVRRLDQGPDRFELVAGDAAAAVAADSRPRAKPSRPAGAEPGAGRFFPSPRNDRPLVIAVTGPTGAGKTTTAAKLATNGHAFGGRRVGLLSLDRFRPGAMDQLGTYARMARVPLASVREPEDVPRVLRRFRHCEVLIVDTPGRSPRENEDMEIVRDTLRALAPDEVHLVLPAGLAPGVARRVLAQASAQGATHLLPTKLDETAEHDAVRALSLEFGLPIRWLAEGQRIPKDLRSS